MFDIDKIKGGLIVSCQAYEGEPLFGAHYMERMAVAAFQSGAVGIRANGPNDIAAIRKSVPLPIIGIYKIHDTRTEVYITPTLDSARVIVQAGADIVAVDATNRKLADGRYTYDLISDIKRELNVPVMADVSTLEEGIMAEKAGVDIISTTMAGYTPYSRPATSSPDFILVQELANNVKVPVICEGRIWTVVDAIKAFDLGAFAVVIGSAITAPQLITERFVQSINSFKLVKEKLE